MVPIHVAGVPDSRSDVHVLVPFVNEVDLSLQQMSRLLPSRTRPRALGKTVLALTPLNKATQ